MIQLANIYVKERYILIVLFIISFALRLMGMWTHSAYIDESLIVHRSLQILKSGDVINVINNEVGSAFQYGVFISYLQAIFGLVSVKAMSFFLHNLSVNFDLLLILSRLLSVAFSSANVIFVYLIGKILFNNKKICLIAALIMAFSLNNIVQSKYALSSSEGLFFFLFFLYCTLQISDNSQKVNYLFCVLAGIAGSIVLTNRFNFIPIIYFPVYFILFNKRKYLLTSLLIFTPIYIIFFILFTPQILFTFHDFVKKIHDHHQSNQTFLGTTRYIYPNCVWYFLFLGLSDIYTFNLFAFFSGFVIGVKKHFKISLLLSIPLVVYFYAWEGIVVMSERYVVYILPFIALFCGISYCWFIEIRNKLFHKCFLFSVVAILLFCGFRGVWFDYLITFKEDTRKIANKWLRDNKKDSIILIQDMEGKFIADNLRNTKLIKEHNLDFYDYKNVEHPSNMYHYSGEVVVMSSFLYRQALNYRNISDFFKKISDSYEFIFTNAKLLKEFNYWAFESGFLEPKFLQNHNSELVQGFQPTIKIYEIPKISKKSIDFTFLPGQTDVQTKADVISERGREVFFYDKKHDPFYNYPIDYSTGITNILLPQGKYTFKVVIKTAGEFENKIIGEIVIANNNNFIIRKKILHDPGLKDNFYNNYSFHFENPIRQALKFGFIYNNVKEGKVWIDHMNIKEYHGHDEKMVLTNPSTLFSSKEFLRKYSVILLGFDIMLPSKENFTLNNVDIVEISSTIHAFRFKGNFQSSIMVDVPLHVKDKFSIGFWVKCPSSGINSWIVNHSWFLLSMNTGDDQIAKLDLNTIDVNVGTKKIPLTFNYNYSGWHFITAVYDGTIAKVYIDGILYSSAEVHGGFRNDQKRTIIGMKEGGSQYFTGMLTELFLMPYALEEQEIQTIYQEYLMKNDWVHR